MGEFRTLTAECSPTAYESVLRTILGATFASMFPELSHRLVLDGVADAQLYSNDMAKWASSGMQDTEKVLSQFFIYCAEAGPGRCDFAKHNVSASQLRSEYEEMLDQLVSEPLSVSTPEGSGIVEASDLQFRMFWELYTPNTWTSFASVLSDLSRGNGTLLLRNRYMPLHPPAWDDNVFHRHIAHRMDYITTKVISCGDTVKPDAEARTFDASYKTLLELDAMSPTGDFWARWPDACRKYRTISCS